MTHPTNNKRMEKPIEKFDEVYNKGKGRIEIIIPVSKIFHWLKRRFKK